MEAGINIEKIWQDDDMYEFRISSSDGSSVFVQEVYVGYGNFDKLIEDLDVFKNHIYGGLYDIEFGSFGPEYASGAFHARMHFQERGKIYVSIKAQSEYKEFGIKKVASEASLYFITEPSLLDSFITNLKSLNNGNTATVCLQSA